MAKQDSERERAIVLAWLGRPEATERIARWFCERFGYAWSMSPAELDMLTGEAPPAQMGEAYERRICDTDATSLLAALRQLAEEGK